jgi:hypothetical protein
MYFRILMRTMFDVPVSIPTSLSLPSVKSDDSTPIRLHG